MNIDSNVLAAALKCAAKNDVRFYMEGVYLDFQKGRIVATDGHILFAGAIERAELPAAIVPRALVESALKSLTARQRKNREPVQVAISGDAVTIVAGNASRFTQNRVDGTFLEYERIIPRKTSGEIAQFNPDLLVTARDALNLYQGNTNCIGYGLQHNGNSAALMLGRGCFCVVMPARLDTDGDLTWFDNPAASESAAA